MRDPKPSQKSSATIRKVKWQTLTSLALVILAAAAAIFFLDLSAEEALALVGGAAALVGLPFGVARRVRASERDGIFDSRTGRTL